MPRNVEEVALGIAAPNRFPSLPDVITMKEAGIPMNVNHRLRVGSVSKTITSTTIFRLIQSGATYGGGKKLTLDSPITGPDGILPDLKAPQLPQFASAKLHHVLEHTAGLPGNLSNEEVADPTNCSAGNLVQRINDVIAQVKPIPAPPPGGSTIPKACLSCTVNNPAAPTPRARG